MGPLPTAGRRTAWTAALLVALLQPALTPTQGSAQPRPFPYSLGSRDVILLPLGVGLMALDRALVGKASPLSPDAFADLTPASVNRFDRRGARSWSPAWEDRSDLARNGLLAAAAAATLLPPAATGRWREAAVMGVLFAETGLLLQGATGSLKGMLDRRRPWLYNSALTPGARAELAREAGVDAHRSFPSGHASSAFALAVLLPTLWTDVRGRSAGSDALWAVSLSAASFAAYARVAAGQHYPTDVLAGAALGAGIGYLIPALHRGPASERVQVAAGPAGIRVRVTPGGG